MAYFHQDLTQAKWNALPKDKQILNVASELLRARNSLAHGYDDNFHNSMDRALELIDLSLNDRQQWLGGSLKELLRFREYLAGFYQERKPTDDFTKLIENFLLFHPQSSLVRL